MLLRNPLRRPATKKKPSQEIRGSREGGGKSCCGCFAPLTPFRERVQGQENIKLEERRGSMTKAAIVILADTESKEALGFREDLRLLKKSASVRPTTTNRSKTPQKPACLVPDLG